MDVKRPLTATTAAQHGSQAETGMAVVDWSSEAIGPVGGAAAVVVSVKRLTDVLS